MAAAVVAVPVLVPQTASASPSAGKSTGRHCVLDVTGQKPSGEFITAPMRCYSTYDEVLASEGVTLSTPGESRTAIESARQAAAAGLLTTYIAVHYVNSNGDTSAGSLSVIGSTPCLGGTLPMPTGFINNISSTWTDCVRVRHFDNANLTGAFGDTFTGTQNLSASGMNDRTESAQYLNS